jgi:exodeoxyribonuclease V gamma subunit
MSLQVFVSNRLEYLAILLAEALKSGCAPLQREFVVVPSQAMERFLSMCLAKEHGICANVLFPYPGRFISHLARHILYPPQPPLTAQGLTWRIYAALTATHRGPHPSSDQDRLHLAQTLANLWEGYMMFRPHWAALWEAGRSCGELGPSWVEDEAWQRDLWCQVMVGWQSRHLAALMERLVQRLQESFPASLPHRIFVFGISSLPPILLDILEALGRHIPVSIYALSPSPLHWERRADAEGEGAGRLLASLGTTLRDYLDAIILRAPQEPIAVFAPPQRTTILHALQADLYEMPLTPPVDHFSSQAQGLEIHVCSSPRREVEVLRQRLLDLLHRDATLKPQHILVVVPDLTTYGPLFHAVWESEGAPRLPYSLAAAATPSPEAQSLFALLRAATSRMERSTILELLDTPPTRTLLGLTDTDISTLEYWIHRAGVAWGLDSAFRQEHGLFPSQVGTWRQAMLRLALGYAADLDDHLLLDILPLPLLRQHDREIAAAFAAWLGNLETLARSLRHEAPAWDTVLPWVLETFFPHDPNPAYLALYQRVKELLAAWTEAGKPAVPAPAMTEALLQATTPDPDDGGQPFTHGITVASPAQMRAIPFRVIAWLGLAAGTFPRSEIRPALDLLAAAPRPGDSNRTLEDRSLFLETLLCARDHFLLFYPTTSPEHPEYGRSTLVDELLSYLDSRMRVGGKLPSQALTTVHPAYAFLPEAVDATAPWPNYSPQLEAAARSLLGPRRNPPILWQGCLPAQPLPPLLDIQDWADALAHPCRGLLRHLGVMPDLTQTPPSDDEPTSAPAGIHAVDLKTRLLKAACNGASAQQLLHLAQSWQAIPDTPEAEALASPIIRSTMQLARRLQDWGEPVLSPIHLDIAGTRIHGAIPLAHGRVLLTRPARCTARDVVRLHLYTLATVAAGLAHEGVHLAEEETLSWRPQAPHACAALELLLQLWSELHRRPLPFMPRACIDYVRGLAKDQKAATQAWHATWHDKEKDLPVFQVCFPDGQPDPEESFALARILLAPLLPEGCHG